MTGKAMTLLSGQYVSRFLAFVGFVLLAAFAPAQQVDAVPYAAYVMDARTGETVSATPAELTKLVIGDVEKYTKVIKAAGIVPQ